MSKSAIDIEIESRPRNTDFLLKKGFFKVPQYQRNYRWQEDNWQEFYDTIENGQDNFLGTIFLYKNNTGQFNEIFEVIDGQQRLTTILIIIKALELVINEMLSSVGLQIPKKSKLILETTLDDLKEFRIGKISRKDQLRLSVQELEKAQSKFKEIMNLENIPNFKYDLLKKRDDTDRVLNSELTVIKEHNLNLKNHKLTLLGLDKGTKEQQKLSNIIKDINVIVENLKGSTASYKKEKAEIKKQINELTTNRRSFTQTQIFLSDALEFFVKKFIEKDDLKTLLKFKDQLLLKSFFIIVQTSDKNSIYEYFKSLNATGVQLAVSDIFKNDLFRAIPSTKASVIIKEFEQVIDKLDSFNLSEDDFLLHSINSGPDAFNLAKKMHLNDRPINKEKLLSSYDLLLAGSISPGSKNAEELIKQLNIDLEIYLKIVVPAKVETLKLTDEEFYFYNLLREVVPSKAIAFLMASKKKNTNKEHLKACKIATYVAVRHAIMPNRDMKTLESIFYKARKALYNGTRNNLYEDEFKLASAYMPNTSKITADYFASHNWSNGQALALNCLVYRHQIIKAPKSNDYYKDLSAEHIMPQSPNEITKIYWHSNDVINLNSEARTDKDVYLEYAKKIGNYIILWGRDNSSLGNKTFLEKKMVYRNYPYPHIKNIAKIKNWSQSDIVKRSNVIFNLFEKLK